MACEKQRGYAEATVGGNTLQISFEQLSDTLSKIVVKTLKNGEPAHAAAYRLPYPVYRFDVGDVTGNGVPDIAVGVVKATTFDTNTAKRPFLFKITDEGDIRPLWLGSRVSQPLEDFALTKNETPAKVLTIERERSGKFLVAVYRYHGFGLEHNGYVKREISKKEAYNLLRKGKYD
ncbi:MAG: hypothetical protein LBH93_01790 [Chitinispirillales bacterium]|nr:hypothetical protein [Chitinispirillales bacterium]